MSVTGTSAAAAATMLAAAAAIFITFVICFYLFLCAKRYRGAAPNIGGGGGADGRARGPRFVFGGPCNGRGLDETAIVALPRRVVAQGDPASDCAVCITELAAGETARLLPRCGHAFHVECVDMWLRSHSTCPLCRCPVADEAPTVHPPEADPESPIFPTNVLFFGSQSQDAATTGGAPRQPVAPQVPQPAQGPMAGVAAVVEAARTAALRRLLGCGGATAPPPPPPPQAERDVETGLAAGESSTARPAKPQPGS